MGGEFGTHFRVSVQGLAAISGTGRYLKEQNPNIRIVGVDPQCSILKEYIDQGTMGEPAPYKVEGIGEDIIPGALHKQYVDEVVRVTDRQSFVKVRRLARQEGILVGSSSGAAVAGALEAARRMPDDAVIVVVLPDTGQRYLSKAHSEEWQKENRLLEGYNPTAGEIQERRPPGVPALVRVQEATPVREAISLVRQYEVSQVPVLRGEDNVGVLQEAKLLRQAFEAADVLDKPAAAVMDPPQ